MQPPPLVRLWSTDWGLRALLIVLIIVIFVIRPLFEIDQVGQFVFDAVFSLILISGVAAVARTRMALFLVSVFAVVTLTLRWLDAAAAASMQLTFLNTIASLLYCGLLAGLVLVQVFREGPVTVQRIEGAVAAYLLFGLTWGFGYRLVELYVPGAFNQPASITARGGADPTAQLMYFSFVTLTTVGYGDITAVHPVARALTMAEALMGQLFPAILIARLVSMELVYRQRNR